MQVRIGPNRVGRHGLLQPIADVFKLLLKEDIVPTMADKKVHLLAPILVAVASIGALAVVPFAGPEATISLSSRYRLQPVLADVNVGIIYVLAISSLGVFGIVLGGWASNSKYSLLGGLRSAAQMVSYEVPLALALIGPMIIAGTASMTRIVQWQQQHTWLFWLQPVGLVLFYIAGVAENNRAPFDLPEAENELVAGFHTEYSGMKFAFFFLAEYIAMIVVSAMVVTVFFGGWLPITFGLGYIFKGLPRLLGGAWGGPAGLFVCGVFWFSVKVTAVIWCYLWLRATFPRYRYDQLMRVGWKFMIPVSLVWILATGAAVILIDAVAR
jgi:NADH-quinone oxidoreductase subunit H